MNTMKENAKTVAAMLAASLFLLSAPARAEYDDEVRAESEIGACIAEIAEHADYSDASRVRHSVAVMKRRAVGYKLSIETSVYSGDDEIREYATQCVAFGDAEPVRFRFAETANRR